MEFVNAVVSGYKGFVKFDGRTPRAPFWYWMLFQIIIIVIISFIEGGGHTVVEGAMIQSHYEAGPIATVWSLINFLPGLAIGIRRLHDLDKSGWWTLIAFTGIGAIVLLLGRLERDFGREPVRTRSLGVRLQARPPCRCRKRRGQRPTPSETRTSP